MPEAGDDRVVLVTGAGASRNLGSDGTMPLMVDWGTDLGNALDAREPGLAAACGLANPADGQQFEQSLGKLLTWGRGLPLVEEFVNLTSNNPQQRNNQFRQHLKTAQQRWPSIIETINTTLWDEFGIGRIDPKASRSAFFGLLKSLGVAPRGNHLFAATTNYDPSMEVAFDQLGDVTTGFHRPAFSTPYLSAEKLDPWQTTEVPVVHLHGAVGWYRDDASGQIIETPTDQDFDARRTPVVLYPDPSKNPFAEEGVAILWSALREALQSASHVVIIGHSLHDAPLIQTIGSETLSSCRILITYFREEELDSMRELAAEPLATSSVEFVQFEFGPKADFAKIGAWRASDSDSAA